MKITPEANNHIRIETDDGDVYDVNDGGEYCGLHIRLIEHDGRKEKQLNAKQDAITGTVTLKAVDK